jgi:hypothetical protein
MALFECSFNEESRAYHTGVDYTAKPAMGQGSKTAPGQPILNTFHSIYKTQMSETKMSETFFTACSR